VEPRCPQCECEGLEDHPCPFKDDIFNDSESLCNCCSHCRHECAMDI
jgi:hypothetical protein